MNTQPFRRAFAAAVRGTLVGTALGACLLLAGCPEMFRSDSENANRFCKWWRETPAKMELRIAVQRPGSEVEIITATCIGRIADKPEGPLLLGWDRLFVPDGYDDTLAELTAAGELVAFRRIAYEAVVAALAS